MPLTEQAVLEALRSVRFPGFRRDIVALGVVRHVAVEGHTVRLDLDAGPQNAALAAPLERAARAAVEALAGVERIELRSAAASAGAPALKLAGSRTSVAAAGGLDTALLPEVRHVLAVASGKGGVGKSTVAMNLAVALAHQGLRVGLLDADIYGPSIPLMAGIRAQPDQTTDGRIVPFERFGVRLMSLGFLVDPEQAVIWRGPMVMKAIDTLLREVVWGELDLLVVDLPPGTGDAQLTLAQKVQLAGAVIVTTPQDVALADAIKGVAMFRKVNVKVLGLVENMSFFECPGCSQRSEIFGRGGGRREAARLGVPDLGEIPLDPAVRVGGDTGAPIVHAAPDSAAARAFDEIATRLRATLGLDVLPARSSAPPAGGLLGRIRRAWHDPAR